VDEEERGQIESAGHEDGRHAEMKRAVAVDTPPRVRGLLKTYCDSCPLVVAGAAMVDVLDD
jgi:hypothetical protein